VACKLNFVSKRLGSIYDRGLSPKNPKAPAVTRGAEEDGGVNRESLCNALGWRHTPVPRMTTNHCPRSILARILYRIPR
jgi:hypothetical protein